jgi:uncharacterized protein YecE (DUF72 family)
MGRGVIRVGSVGWHYAHWVGPFYPRGIRASEMLAWYARRFQTVEVSNTFHHLPSAATLKRWCEQTPRGFVFSCRANRYLTHVRRLDASRRTIVRFFRAIDVLGDRLGPVVFQLPQYWRQNIPRLRRFLARLPSGYRFVFEFGDESWRAPEIVALMTAHNAAYAASDPAARRTPVPPTADFVYLRLHGPDPLTPGPYHGRTLSLWARRIDAWRREGRDVYCCFGNDVRGHAAADAMRLKAQLARRPPARRRPTR